MLKNNKNSPKCKEEIIKRLATKRLAMENPWKTKDSYTNLRQTGYNLQNKTVKWLNQTQTLTLQPLVQRKNHGIFSQNMIMMVMMMMPQWLKMTCTLIAGWHLLLMFRAVLLYEVVTWVSSCHCSFRLDVINLHLFLSSGEGHVVFDSYKRKNVSVCLLILYRRSVL